MGDPLSPGALGEALVCVTAAVALSASEKFGGGGGGADCRSVNAIMKTSLSHQFVLANQLKFERERLPINSPGICVSGTTAFNDSSQSFASLPVLLTS